MINFQKSCTHFMPVTLKICDLCKLLKKNSVNVRHFTTDYLQIKLIWLFYQKKEYFKY